MPGYPAGGSMPPGLAHEQCCKVGCENPPAFHLIVASPVEYMVSSIGSCREHAIKAITDLAILDMHEFGEACQDESCWDGEFKPVSDEVAKMMDQQIQSRIRAQEN